MSTSLKARTETGKGIAAQTVQTDTPRIPVCVNQENPSRGPNKGTSCRFSSKRCICIEPGQTAFGADFSSCEYVCHEESEIESTMYRLWYDTSRMTQRDRRTWQQVYPSVGIVDGF